MHDFYGLEVRVTEIVVFGLRLSEEHPLFGRVAAKSAGMRLCDPTPSVRGIFEKGGGTVTTFMVMGCHVASVPSLLTIGRLRAPLQRLSS